MQACIIADIEVKKKKGQYGTFIMENDEEKRSAATQPCHSLGPD